jgi:pantoate--beta-alanine ligase
MVVPRTRAGLAAARARLTGRLGLVPTMGALHEGHRRLVERAAAGSDAVAVSIFVNPTQFGPTEDLATYPRDLAADLALCRAEGVRLAFVPDVAEMYPGGSTEVTVAPGPLGTVLEGRVRPTHFAGVLTVVAKLFNLVRPDVGYFGEKDYQQLVLIRRMVRDLDLGVQIVGCPTVREPDGLAMSSRNRCLSTVDRQRARALSRALRAGAEAGVKGADAVLDAARAELSDVDTDYLELRDPDLGPAPERGPARLLVAARLGTTRLIDNISVSLGDE